MSDENYVVEERTQSGLFIALVGFAVLASAAGLIWSYTLENRLEKSQAALVNAQQQNDKLAESLNETNAKLRVTTETLGQSVGMTQKQLEDKAQIILASQHADTVRLERAQAANFIHDPLLIELALQAFERTVDGFPFADDDFRHYRFPGFLG